MNTFLNRNISILLNKNINYKPLTLRCASFSINSNKISQIKCLKHEPCSQLKLNDTSNLFIFLVSKRDFTLFNQKFQVRQEKSSSSGKILTSLEHRNSNDDQVSTHVRPTEKGYYFA